MAKAKVRYWEGGGGHSGDAESQRINFEWEAAWEACSITLETAKHLNISLKTELYQEYFRRTGRFQDLSVTQYFKQVVSWIFT